ncbi:MAG: tRNA (N6-isopentenyl adenosine(37)-C2)-methylthiotransferase MiaB [Candidatus Staskawiczbacteria bacterium RIFOXYD2_FULL_37_10]|nr:MAG: tRNA (N6-isopentenyl adenosine(37)-C2)-methylthiotransferase MiaB [Candidatus Staskawiczbacteria bacterium RIFOXYD2_FULL_37_10]
MKKAVFYCIIDKMKYHIITFGCQMNVSDSERIAGVLEGINFKKTSNINEANLIAVTMCSVRQSAVDRVHGLVQKFKKLNPKIKTILTGCILEKDRKKFINSFDYVIDIKDIKKLPEILKISPTRQAQKLRDNVIFAHSNYLDITPKYSNEFSAAVPIMTGCNNFCSYCVVPYTRGREVSRQAKEIISEIKILSKKNYKEIWLLGQNVNSYKDGKTNFPKLLKMANNIPGDFKLCFITSHPKDFSDELIKTMKNCKKLSKRLNLPIQSGDDEILKKMNRPYTVAQYKALVKKIRKAIPDISLSTDIIVGFPGETKKQFQNTVKTLKEIGFDMAFVNKYSPRAGTAASKMTDNVPWAEKKRREKILIELVNEPR